MALVAPSLGGAKQQEGEAMEDSSWHIGITPPSSNDGEDSDSDDTSSSSSATTKTKAKAAGKSEIAFVNKLDELARIMEDDIQLVVWEQQPEQPNFIKVTTYGFGHIYVYLCRTQHALSNL